MTALADPELSPRAENTVGRREGTPARGFLPGAIKQLFRDVAKAVIQTLAPSPAQRRKRREETQRGFIMAARRFACNARYLGQQFRKLAATVRRRVLPAHFFHDPGFSREERRAKAERVLRAQIDEWAREEESYQQDDGFRTAVHAHFDPHL